MGSVAIPVTNLTQVLDADSWSGRRHLLEKVLSVRLPRSNLGSAPERAVSTVLSESPTLSSPEVAGSVPLAGLVLERYRRVRDDQASLFFGS